ncbi:MAG: transglycosylase domain-containing protein [Chloroflexota bacterium]
MRRLHHLIRRHTRKLLAALALLIIAAGAFIYFWIFHDLPSIDDIDQGMALPVTRIYDRSGQLLYEILPPGEDQGRSKTIPLEAIPQHCINAVIATEDANFYEHPGVDIVSVIRALWINVRGGEVLAGGSTITQQTARLLLMDPQQRLERTLRRKLREMVLAVRLQNRYSKDEVLALYLNQNYFGNLAYGIEGAARTYFARSATDLSLAECALLAGLMQNPAAYDPFTRLDAARDRQRVVLDLMVDRAFIGEDEANAAARDELQFAAVRFPIEAPHAVMAVWEQLERDYPAYVYGGGLDVVTTIDLNWTRAAERIAQAQLERLNNPPGGGRAPANAQNAAVVAMDPNTGQVLTLLGSPDYFNEAIDGAVNAALMPRQPGSTLKPFTFAAAMNPQLENPYTAATMILDVHTPFVTRRLESYAPANYGLVEHGPVLVREALASSYNIPAVVALDFVGIDTLIQFLANAGIENLTQNTRVDLSITLGGGEVRLLDLVQAYGIFPNGGYRVEPSLILSVRTHDGETLYEWQPPVLDQHVLDERIAYIMNDILSDEEARIPSFGRNSWLSIGRTAAAKTGTTTDFRDNWVVGYTPNLVVGVWVGNADNTPMVDVTGISGAGPIWNHFMRTVLLGQPELAFERPAGITSAEVCALSGLLPTDACTFRTTELFIEGTVPTETDTMSQTFAVNRQTGELAGPDTPPEDTIEQVFVMLPEEARAWGVRNGVRQPPQGSAIPIGHSADVRFLSPDPYTIFQISPMLPRETQRIRLETAVPTDAESVTLTLQENEGDVVMTSELDAAPWSMWWTLETGAYSLTAEATLPDGSVVEAQPLYFAVTEYETQQESYNVPVTP